jgi:hypothetical protein
MEMVLLVYTPDMSALLGSLACSTSAWCRSRPLPRSCGVISRSTMMLPARRRCTYREHILSVLYPFSFFSRSTMMLPARRRCTLTCVANVLLMCC